MKRRLNNSKQDQCAVCQQTVKLSTKTRTVSEQLGKSLANVARAPSTRQPVTCNRMEQAAFWEDRSSRSEPLEPDDDTLVWSAGTLLDPSLAVRRLRAGVNQFGNGKTQNNSKQVSIYIGNMKKKKKSPRADTHEESFFVRVRWLRGGGEHKSTGGSNCQDSS